jgi:hypothetical protein
VLTPWLGITAVAAVTGVVSVGCGLGLLLLAQRRAGIRFNAEFAVHFLRCCGATLVAVGVGEVVLWSGFPLSGLIGLGAGSIGYFAVLLVLDPETRLLWKRLRTRT